MTLIISFLCFLKLVGPAPELTYIVGDLPTAEVTGRRIICMNMATVYNAVPGQTDDTPFITADNSQINPNDPLSHRWVAISWDLREYFSFGDTILIKGINDPVYSGKWVVRDLMNRRWEKKIDFLTHEKWGRWTDFTIEKS